SNAFRSIIADEFSLQRRLNTMTSMQPWPSLSMKDWRDTYATLHMWTQIVGKICLALTPQINHFWNITLYVTPRGLMTPLMPYADRAFPTPFDFIGHQLLIQSSADITETVSLEPRTVADFHQLLMSTLRRMNIDVRIWTMPVEVPNPIRFEADVTHRSYDPEVANALWRILLSIK